MFGTELLASATSDRRQLSGGTHPPYLTSPLLEFLKGGEEIRCSSRRSPNNEHMWVLQGLPIGPPQVEVGPSPWRPSESRQS
ncbi:hypothetical protein H5410_037386 [Solanum commersonii]|uniref:Uncharacterized protein n=1 Tax=Solanum commersonii TaxID=4109 RepID=A0A9J5Y7W2_SOLCO|nr:hypothetical protein H5410_037386 [Solanum commersonii]